MSGEAPFRGLGFEVMVKDTERQNELEAEGICVSRFTNIEVENNWKQ